MMSTMDSLERVEEHELSRAAAQYRFEAAMRRRHRWDLDSYLYCAAAMLWLIIGMWWGMFGAVPCFAVGLWCTVQARRAEEAALECLYTAGKSMGAQAAIHEYLVSGSPMRFQVTKAARNCIAVDHATLDSLRGRKWS